jgi:hypothetical protein
VTRNAEELGARVLGSAEAVEPRSSTTHDRWAHGDGLHIGYSRWATVETGVGWKWWL